MNARRLVLPVFATALGVLMCMSVPAMAAAPEVPETIGPAQAVTATTATLEGALNPKAAGELGEYEFLYRASATECEGGGVAPEPAGIALGFKEEVESVGLTGLQPNTQYTFCLLARNLAGEAAVGLPVTFTTLAAPPQIDGESAPVVRSSGATLEAQVNPNNEATKYSFRYASDKALTGASTVEGASVLEGFGDQAASVTIATGTLKASTTYYYRVLAENQKSEEEGRLAEGEVQEFTTLPSARIDSESAAEVAGTSATLQAEINPLGTDTTYHFEYGTSTAYGSSTPLVDIGSGEGDAPVSVHLDGLAPGTVYHYRVVATNTLGTLEGVDHELTTQSAGEELALPDGRQYELVSPLVKYGGEVAPPGHFSNGGVAQAAEDGSAITYLADSPYEADPPENYLGSQYLSRRGAEEWSTQDISPHTVPRPVIAAGTGTEFRGFSADLEASVIQQFPRQLPLTQNAPPDMAGMLYVRDDGDGGLEPVLTSPPPEAENNIEPEQPSNTFHFLGGTPDFSHVVFANSYALTPKAYSYAQAHESFGENLYEWSAGGLQQVNVLSDGASTGTGEGSYLGGDTGNGQDNARHAISNDGSHIIWSVERHQTVEGIYDRNMATGETVQLNVSQEGHVEPGEQTELEFQTASGDGSKVFFTDSNPLTADANTGPLTSCGVSCNRRPGSDLYAFDVASGKLTDIAPDPEGDGAMVGGLINATHVGGVLGASEDGSYVYFYAEGHLAGSGSGGLYVAHEEGGVWRTRFIAPAADRNDWNSRDLALMTSRVSPNGRYVAFMSQASLTGYDNRDAVSGQPDAEVYVYDAGSGRLTCASCNPTGQRPIGREVNEENREPNWWVTASIPGWTPIEGQLATYQSRYLSDEGRLFFETSEALVAQDTNGEQDVYEYEPAGVGSCAEAGGCVDLISGGTGSGSSTFLDASASGQDVFFITSQALVAQDTNRELDVYDAHVCTVAVSCFAPVLVVPPPCGTGDACKAAPTPQPAIFGAPASATFSGAGNPSAAPMPAVSVGKAKAKRPKRHRGRHRDRGRAKGFRVGRGPSGHRGRR